MNLSEINDQIQKYPETIFDTFNLEIDLRSSGSSLRNRLAELSNLYGRINQLASNSLFMYEQAKNRRDKVESIAWGLVDKKEKVTMQKILVRTIKVNIGEPTTLNDEEERVSLYAYIYNKGRDKVREISSVLDVGRTLLSWDKQELSKVQY